MCTPRTKTHGCGSGIATHMPQPAIGSFFNCFLRMMMILLAPCPLSVHLPSFPSVSLGTTLMYPMNQMTIQSR